MCNFVKSWAVRDIYHNRALRERRSNDGGLLFAFIWPEGILYLCLWYKKLTRQHLEMKIDQLLHIEFCSYLTSNKHILSIDIVKRNRKSMYL